VITTPLSAAYTALACMMVGARPVFADVDPRRLTIDPTAVESAVTPRTAAILPVHLYGQPADMPRSWRLPRATGLPLSRIAASRTLRPAWDAHRQLRRAAAYSFYPPRTSVPRDGGAVTTAMRHWPRR